MNSKLNPLSDDELESWSIGSIKVSISLSQPEGIEFDLAVKSKEIPLFGPFLNLSEDENITGKSAAIQDESADEVIFWPQLSIRDRRRRSAIRNKTSEALRLAMKNGFERIVFLTAGLEATGVPSWEVAEECSKAVYLHSGEDTSVKGIWVIAGTHVQINSFRYVLNNVNILFSKD